MSESPQSMFSDGAAYEQHMGRWSKIAGRKFLDWLAPPKGLRWLDCGCGNGSFTEEILNNAAPSAVTGVDPSEGQIAFARQRSKSGIVTFQVGDAQALPLPDASVDASVMALAIAFVPDPAKGVSELARVTRAGGTVASYMWDIKGFGVPHSPIYKAIKEIGLEAPRPPSFEASVFEAGRNLWRDAGLKDVETTIIRINVTFKDFDDFWQSNTLPVGPHAKFVNALSPEKKDELRSILRKSLPTAADGSITYEAFANAVKGVKA